MPAPVKRKIINDPVYGFITINHALVFDIIAHPYYQRLRRIQQMALAQLVYPGAVHTRLHHSLGAYHLMCQAVIELRNKNVDITAEEEVAVKAAILLHDIGHGPFSHALENILTPGINHEQLSLRIMQLLNEQMNGGLALSIQIFTNQYHKPFLHQLISGQLDVDRMDYLTRDSFYTGVSEGVIGYDRILKMLTVKDGELMVEEKGILSVEKFLVARRQMYWQVYLHKAVLAAEKMLVKIMARVKELHQKGNKELQTTSVLDAFISSCFNNSDTLFIDAFCRIDDNDVMFAIKRWSMHEDVVLSTLCKGILERRLLKCALYNQPVDEKVIIAKQKEICSRLNISMDDAAYLAFTGETTNTTYVAGDEHIKILFKDETVKDISKIDNALIHQTLLMPVKKFYICQLL